MACQFYCPRYYDLTMKAVDFVEQHLFVDVKLVCKNKKTVYSHKLILASASPFLRTVIEEMNSNDDMATVFLPDFDYNIVSSLLTFLYEGRMKLSLEELGDFRELCNGLCMTFPGAQVVKVSEDSHYSQSTGSRQAADIASRDVLHTPAEVPDTTSTCDALASIVPKIEDCEECQNFETSQPASGNDFQNTSQMCDVNTTQQSLIDCNFSQPEKHRQESLEAGESITYSDATGNAGSWRKVNYSHDDTFTNLNLWHARSSSTQELSQYNVTSHEGSSILVPRSTKEIEFHRSDSHFAHQKSTQQMVQHLKSMPNNSHSESDMSSISLTLSAAQSACQQMQKQSKAKTKKLHNGAGVQKKHLTQLLNSSVHKELPQQIGTISHRMKQSPHLNSTSKQSESKVCSKRQSKYLTPKKRKESEGTVR